jgi:hypothetical protein
MGCAIYMRCARFATVHAYAQPVTTRGAARRKSTPLVPTIAHPCALRVRLHGAFEAEAFHASTGINQAKQAIQS